MLRRLIETMNLPPARKNLTIFSNLLWLNRNMGIRNYKHPQYFAARRRLNYILSLNRDKR